MSIQSTPALDIGQPRLGPFLWETSHNETVESMKQSESASQDSQRQPLSSSSGVNAAPERETSSFAETPPQTPPQAPGTIKDSYNKRKQIVYNDCPVSITTIHYQGYPPSADTQHPLQSPEPSVRSKMNPNQRVDPWKMSTKSRVTTMGKKSRRYRPQVVTTHCKDAGHRDMPTHLKVYYTACFSQPQDIGSDIAIKFWDPYPNQNIDDRFRQEMHYTIGDVGLFTSRGTFLVLFNIFMSKEDNLKMKYRIPPAFEPLNLNPEDVHYQPMSRQTKNFFSPNFVNCGEDSDPTYKFKSICPPTDMGGAILVLPEGYLKQYLKEDVGLSQYAEDYMESWYDLASQVADKRDGVVQNGSLKVIVACYKTRIWAAAVLPTNPQFQSEDCSKIELRPSPAQTDNYIWSPRDSPPYIRTHGSSDLRDDKEKIPCTIAGEMLTLYYDKPRSTRASKIQTAIATWSQQTLRKYT